jgi:hypothetical protein
VRGKARKADDAEDFQDALSDCPTCRCGLPRKNAAVSENGPNMPRINLRYAADEPEGADGYAPSIERVE